MQWISLIALRFFSINSPKVVEILIRNGADVNTVSRLGITPLDSALSELATENMMMEITQTSDLMPRLKEIADLLRKHGGKTGEELKAGGK